MNEVSYFIEYAHRGQKRKTGAKYVSHLYEVRDLLIEDGINDEDILKAALLHDVIEDTCISKSYLELRFGSKVAEIVSVISKDSFWKTRYCKTKAHVDAIEEKWIHYPEAVLIKMADRLHNLQTIHGFDANKRKKYLFETKNFIMPLFQKIMSDRRAGKYKKNMQNLFQKIGVQVQALSKSLSE